MLILKIIQSQKRPKKPWLCLNVSRPSEISIFLLFNVRLQSWGITTQEADFLSGFTEFRDIPDFTQVAEFYRISARSGCPEFREAQTFLESVPLVQVTSCFFCDLLHYTLKKVIARARVFFHCIVCSRQLSCRCAYATQSSVLYDLTIRVFVVTRNDMSFYAKTWIVASKNFFFPAKTDAKWHELARNTKCHIMTWKTGREKIRNDL